VNACTYSMGCVFVQYKYACVYGGGGVEGKFQASVRVHVGVYERAYVRTYAYMCECIHAHMYACT